MSDPFARYFEALPCFLTVQDRNLRIIHANRRFREAFGEYEGRHCYELYKQRQEKCDPCPVEQVFQHGFARRSEERLRCREGHEVEVLVEATPIRDERGEITAVLEMATDVTDLKLLQEELDESQARYRLMFEEVPCYISIQDQDLNMLETNRAFRESFGAPGGRKCFQAYKHREEECLPCPVRRTFADGQAHTREEVVTSNTGRQLQMLVTTAPLLDAAGQIVSVMEMSADITQVRELESQLTSLGLLVGSVSHGLKGLLNGLAGGMYLVDTGFKKDDRQRVAKGWETVQRNVLRLRNMVGDILYYAREREPNWGEVEAPVLAAEVRELVAPRFRQEGVALECALDPAAGEFTADAQAIRSLLVNLLENSLDACRLDGHKQEHRVRFALAGEADRVRFRVEDNGIGMDQETREKAFSLFFSAKGMEGTGLGLFVANRIARGHGGRIALESKPDVGTCFVVELPRRRPPAAGPDAGQKEEGEHV